MEIGERPRIRIFVSSPGDVGPERLAAERVINRLRDQYAPEAIIEPYFWEHEPLTAWYGFQTQVEPPANFQIFVCILWARLGTRLPVDEFHRPDGSEYLSGTEYEFENAFESYRSQGLPDLLIYRKTSRPQLASERPEDFEQFGQQFRAVESFVKKWTEREDGIPTGAHHRFSDDRAFADLLATHLEKFIERRLGDHSRDRRISWKGCPFRGLDVFELEHAPIFFGRRAETTRIVDQLVRQAAAQRAFIVIVGPSGTGKSSLARAGVLDSLLNEPRNPAYRLQKYAVMRPGGGPRGNPFEALAMALTANTAFPALSAYPRLDSILEANPASVIDFIRAQFTKTENSEGNDNRLVLVIDQLEELLADNRCSEATRHGFTLAITSLACSDVVWVIATLRSDFYVKFCEYPEFVDLKRGDGQFDLESPSALQIGQMIWQPAVAAGLQFERDKNSGIALDDQLREDASRETSSLPLIQYCLIQLWESARGRNSDLLTFDDYNRLGRLNGAIAIQADRALANLSDLGRLSLSPLFRQLVRLSLEDGRPTRRQGDLRTIMLDEGMREAVSSFISARLCTTSGDSVEVSHEAIFAHWPPFRRWLTEHGEELRMRARVDAAAARWVEGGRDASLLLSWGLPITEGRRVLNTIRENNTTPSTDDTTEQFIRKSLTHHTLSGSGRLQLLANASLAFGLAMSLGLLGVLVWMIVAFSRDQTTATLMGMAIIAITSCGLSHAALSTIYSYQSYSIVRRLNAWRRLPLWLLLIAPGGIFFAICIAEIRHMKQCASLMNVPLRRIAVAMGKAAFSTPVQVVVTTGLAVHMTTCGFFVSTAILLMGYMMIYTTPSVDSDFETVRFACLFSTIALVFFMSLVVTFLQCASALANREMRRREGYESQAVNSAIPL